MKPFKLITSPGNTDTGRLFVTIDWDGKRLSITGAEGPMANGDARGGCGQIGIPDNTPERGWLKLADGWDATTVERLREIWDRWHLNHMRAGCEHQREAWDTTTPLELVELTWGPAFHRASALAQFGKMPAEEYPNYAAKAHYVHRLTIANKRPKHPAIWGDAGESLLADGYVQRSKVETKPAGQVYPEEHPDGLLLKPCAVCGYRYGSAWLHEDVPEDVLRFLAALPDATEDMPYCWRH